MKKPTSSKAANKARSGVYASKTRLRASAVARGRKLLATPGYPNKKIIAGLAKILTVRFVEEGSITPIKPIFLGKN